MNPILFATALAVCLGSPAFPSTLFYSITGIFPATGTPTTTLSANNTPFEFDFSLPDTPTPVSSNSATFGVNTAITYTLGATSFAEQVHAVAFFTSDFDGGLFITIFTNGGDNIDYYGAGPQLFTGPTSDPILTPGVFSMPYGTINVNGGTLVNVGGTVTATAAPEPASFGLAGLALIAGALVRRGAKN